MHTSIFALLVTGVMSQSSLRISPGPQMFARNAPPVRNIQTFAGATNGESMSAARLPQNFQQNNIDRRQMAALLTAGVLGGTSWEAQAAAAKAPASVGIPLVNFGSTEYYNIDKGPGMDRRWTINPFNSYLNDVNKVAFKGNLDDSSKKSKLKDGVFVSTLGDKPFKDISSCEGIALTAKSNGYTGFKMNLGVKKSQKSPKLGYKYQAPFAVPPSDEYATVNVPFSSFGSPKGEKMDPAFPQDIQRITFEASGVPGDAALDVTAISGYGCKGVSLIEQEDQTDTTFSWCLAAAPLGLLAFFITKRIRVRKAPITPSLLG